MEDEMAPPGGPVGRAFCFGGWGSSPWPECHPQAVASPGPLSEGSRNEGKFPHEAARIQTRTGPDHAGGFWLLSSVCLEDTNELGYLSLGVISRKLASAYNFLYL